MGNWFRTNFCVEITGRWCLQMLASLLLPAAILAAQPLGMNFSQSATVAGMLLVITWWTIGVVKKVPASLFLLVWFCLFSGAPTEVIFTFPLGETFVMLIVTYLFSQAISSCGLVDRVLLPLLIRFARTPFRCILAVIATLFLTMYVVPQPLARLLLVAMLIDKFLRYTTLPTATREVILYAVFAFFAVVNMACKDGDLIMHYAACSASGVDISN